MKKYIFATSLTLLIAAIPLSLYFSIFHSTLATEHSRWGEFGSFIGGVISPSVSVLAFIGLLYSIEVTIKKFTSENDDKQSRFYFDYCVLAYEEARKLLSNENNDRPTWIAAGRSLEHAKKLSELITVDSHLRALEISKLKYRTFFHSVLADKPAAFFYGSADNAISTEEAAKQSTAPEHRYGRHVTSTVKELSAKSIRAVWEAAQFPEGYEDPLNKNFSKEEIEQLLVLYPGLHEYFEYHERFQSASGKLFPKDNKTGN